MTTGEWIRLLRRERGLTQLQLARLLHVSDKAVSKWERGGGLPDVTLIPALSAVLGTSAEALMDGGIKLSQEDAGSMKRMQFYRCPVCGGVMTGTAQAQMLCCGRVLTPMQAHKADEAHTPEISTVEDETLLTFSHPMEKDHHIAFVAQVGYDRMLLVRMYAEGANEVRLPRMPYARLYIGCTNDGLFQLK